MSCCDEMSGNGGAPASAGTGTTPQALYDIDFSTLADQTFANGANVIDGLSWTGGAIGIATRTVFDIGGAGATRGMRYTAPTSGAVNNFTSAAQTSAHLYIPLSTIVPLLDASRKAFFRFYFVTEVYDNNSDCFIAGLWGLAGAPASSAARLRGVIKGRSAGAVVTFGAAIDAGVTNSSTDFSANDQVGIAIDNTGVGQVYTTDYDVANNAFGLPQVSNNIPNAAAAPSVFIDPYNRLFLAFRNAAIDVTPTTAITLRRMQVLQ